MYADAEIRLIGYSFGSLEKMQFHHKLVSFILCDDDVVVVHLASGAQQLHSMTQCRLQRRGYLAPRRCVY